ncbi:MAG: RIP metalloprotease RseP [Candidatus Zambryskibacteria bacterium RIFCSPHIGHO2_01_FULL_35_32]|nr:MAG: RIP metalloprotease RseP [Candidatus Zambryskibacteria bacterium RIFCSPHIGHO2_01_FULL_35_32]
MTFIIFLIILGILIFVHELGHFLVAKGAGVKVEEFGFGYPPRALKLGSKWGTLFTLNWIPFGGFVKIFGENYEENKEGLIDKKEQKHTVPALGHKDNALGTVVFVPSSFTEVSKKWQAAILAAGVTFNIIFAWLILSLGFMIGLPTPIDNDYGVAVENPTLTVIEAISDSPAEEAGLKSGDKIKSLSFGEGQILSDLNLENTSDFINKSQGEILVKIDRGGEIIDFKITPNTKIEDDRKLIGISMDMIGTLSLPIHRAIYEGGKTTFDIAYATIYGIGDLVGKAIKGNPDISQIAGPVGIISLVGDATKLGFVYLLTFTALISINLAIINLLPFPALDGGRIIFVIIESITKRPINPKIAGSLNTVGFALLILLMLIITYRDILRLF